MIGIIAALKTILEIDTVTTTFRAIDAGLDIFGLFDIIKSRLKKESLEYQTICALEDSLEESCNILKWEHDNLAVSQVFNNETLHINTAMTNDELRELFSKLVGIEIDNTALEVIVDCFDKSVADKDKLYRYLNQKWKGYIYEERVSSSESILSQIDMNNKKIRISEDLIFVYDDSPFLYSIKENKKIIISYEECCIICFLIQERGLVISLNDIEAEYSYHARNKNFLEKSSFSDSCNSLEKENHEDAGTICKDLIDQLINLDKTGTIIKYVYFDSIQFDLAKKKRLTPKSVFELLIEYGRPKNLLDIFRDEKTFYEYLFPDLFYRLINKDDIPLSVLYNRQYFIDSVLYHRVRELLLFNNNIKYLIATKCMTVIDHIESFDSFIKYFIKEYGDEPINSGFFTNGVTDFFSLESIFKEDLQNSNFYLQLFWCITISFLHDNIRLYRIDASKVSEEIDAMSMSMGVSHDFRLSYGKEHKSTLYSDPFWLFEILSQTKMVQQSELNNLMNSLNKGTPFPSYHKDIIVKYIRSHGFSIKIGMDVAIVTNDYQLLYVEGSFEIKSVSISGKQITDFQECFFDILDLQNTIGTVRFVSKNETINILFGIGSDKLRIRMRHLVDIMINSNRIISLSVIGMITRAPDDENQIFLIKPILVEIIKSKRDQEKTSAFLSKLKDVSK